MLYILYGPDDFSLQRELGEIKNSLGDKELLAVNTSTFQGKQLSLKELKNACNAAPFLAPSRLVIVEGLLARFEKRRGNGKQNHNIPSKIGDEWRDLAEHIEQMPETTVLVLVDGKLGKDNPLLKKLLQVATVKSFPLMKAGELHGWIQSRVTAHGRKISPGAINLLANLTGKNLRVLANEIDKLLLYAPGHTLEEEDIRCVVSYAREINIFALVDAIMERRGSAAMSLAHQLLNEGEPPSHLVVMLARQIRLAIIAKELDSHRTSQTEIKRRLGLFAEYPFRKTMVQARGYPMGQLEWLHKKLLEMDIAIKTGKWKAIRAEEWKDEFALDIFIAELCQ